MSLVTLALHNFQTLAEGDVMSGALHGAIIGAAIGLGVGLVRWLLKKKQNP